MRTFSIVIGYFFIYMGFFSTLSWVLPYLGHPTTQETNTQELQR